MPLQQQISGLEISLVQISHWQGHCCKVHQHNLPGSWHFYKRLASSPVSSYSQAFNGLVMPSWKLSLAEDIKAMWLPWHIFPGSMQMFHLLLICVLHSIHSTLLVVILWLPSLVNVPSPHCSVVLALTSNAQPSIICKGVRRDSAKTVSFWWLSLKMLWVPVWPLK